MNNKSIKFIGGAILLSIVFFGIFFMMKPKGSVVKISVGKEVYGTYSLEKDNTIEVDLGGGEYNIVQIKDQKVDMIESTCENQICVHEYPLEEGTPGVIVCLPHELIVEIEE
ncbi:MAG: NusG domain II-containing protein [Bacillota bacterium]|nr:NusG domain II-containing protein [Bacillota bacterium]